MASSWYLTPNPHLSSSAPLLEIHFVISFLSSQTEYHIWSRQKFPLPPLLHLLKAGKFNGPFHWKTAPKSNPSSATIICNLKQYCVASVFSTISDSQCNAQSWGEIWYFHCALERECWKDVKQELYQLWDQQTKAAKSCVEPRLPSPKTVVFSGTSFCWTLRAACKHSNPTLQTATAPGKRPFPVFPLLSKFRWFE